MQKAIEATGVDAASPGLRAAGNSPTSETANPCCSVSRCTCPESRRLGMLRGVERSLCGRSTPCCVFAGQKIKSSKRFWSAKRDRRQLPKPHRRPIGQKAQFDLEKRRKQPIRIGKPYRKLVSYQLPRKTRQVAESNLPCPYPLPRGLGEPRLLLLSHLLALGRPCASTL